MYLRLGIRWKVEVVWWNAEYCVVLWSVEIRQIFQQVSGENGHDYGTVECPVIVGNQFQQVVERQYDIVVEDKEFAAEYEEIVGCYRLL